MMIKSSDFQQLFDFDKIFGTYLLTDANKVV